MEKNLSLQLFLMEDDSKILNKKLEKYGFWFHIFPVF